MKRTAASGEVLSLRRRLVLGTALATTAVLGGYRGYVRRAYAACAGAGGTYTCSGVTTTTQTLNGAPLTVTTLPGFSIDTRLSNGGGGGNAFTLTGMGGLTFTDANASGVTGENRGINAVNNASGALAITVTGTVTGTTSDGIFAQNMLGGTDLTIETQAVNGQSNGIYAYNFGSGALSVTANGTVTASAAGGAAINAETYRLSTDLTIEAADVNGQGLGIAATHNGSGALSITATGTVTGRISARNEYGTGTTINVAAVYGDFLGGISALQKGDGDLTINATGPVTGGIDAEARGTETIDITIHATTVTDGIIARLRTSGGGGLSITTTGTVTNDENDGINALNAFGTYTRIETADVFSEDDGINVNHYGGEALTITANGTVTGTNYFGIRARTGTSTPDLVIDAQAVNGGTYGIYAGHIGTGALIITTTGAVTGTSNAGIAARNLNGTDINIETMDVSGGTYGILARNTGTGALTIAVNGTVTGAAFDGISVDTDVTTTDVTIEAATVNGQAYGIKADHYGRGALGISTTGTVTGTGKAGISALNNGGTFLNIETAAVTGGTDGIVARQYGSQSLAINASGAVTGATANGIFAITDASATDLTIAAAAVSGQTYGIDVRHYGTGPLGIATAGAVTGTNGGGIAALNRQGTGLTIETADVSGGTDGIFASHTGTGALTITATGAVTGAAGHGIVGYSGPNTSGLAIETADVSGGSDGIFAIHNGTGALAITATGAVTGAGSRGIFAYSGPDTSGLAIETADASGGTDGIFARHTGAGALTITTTGAVTGNAAGIHAINNSGAIDSTTTVTVTDGATVSGTEIGVVLASYGSVASLVNSGAITGATGVVAGRYGIGTGGPVTISNSGGITGTGGTAIDLTTASGPSTINQQAGTITGDILLSAVADVVNVTGGMIEGDIVGQGNATLNFALGSAPFVVAASSAIAGMAEVNLSSGTVLLQGTADTALMTIDGGTMIVEGAVNTPAFALNGGVLSISSEADLGSAAGVLNFDGGVLQITGTALTDTSRTINWGAAGGGFDIVDAANVFTLDETLSGSGPLAKLGAGTLLITGDSPGFTGTISIMAGMLSVNGSVGSDVDVLSGSRLQGAGVVGDTENFAGGIVAPGNSIGTLTVAGDYTGAGGTLEIEAELGGDASPADRLVVTGNTSGSTDVTVINLGGTGAQTVEGIKVIDVGGASSGTFSLVGDFVFQGEPAVIAGAYAYVLQQNGVSTPTDGDWYLRSSLTNPAEPGEPGGPIYAPGVPLYEAYAGVLQSFNQPGTLQQRLGNRSWMVEAQGADSVTQDVAREAGAGVWGRIEGARGSFEPRTSSSGASYDVSTWKLETGLDASLYAPEAGQLIGGVAFHYGRLSSDIASVFGAGSIDSTGYGVSGTLTWRGNAGLYVDGQAHVTWFDSDLHSDTLATTLASGNDGLGYALSMEAGQRVALAPRWSLTPQAQLAYSSVDFDDFTDPFGAAVSLEDGDSLIGRLGLSADYESEWTDADGKTSRANLYGIANLYYDFLDGSQVNVAGANAVSENEALWGGLGVGGTLSWADGRYSLYGEALARTSLADFGDSHVLSGTVGLRVSW